MLHPKPYPSRAAAEAAISNAIAARECTSGYANVNFSGPGGRTVYHAHVRMGASGWCLR